MTSKMCHKKTQESRGNETVFANKDLGIGKNSKKGQEN